MAFISFIAVLFAVWSAIVIVVILMYLVSRALARMVIPALIEILEMVQERLNNNV